MLTTMNFARSRDVSVVTRPNRARNHDGDDDAPHLDHSLDHDRRVRDVRTGTVR